MGISLYMDVNIDRAVTRGLRGRGVDVLTAQEDGAATMADPDLLDRATALGRVLFSHDQDFLAEAARRQRAGATFAGLIFAHQQHIGIGQCIDDLELIAKLEAPDDLANQVKYIPL